MGALMPPSSDAGNFILRLRRLQPWRGVGCAPSFRQPVGPPPRREPDGGGMRGLPTGPYLHLAHCHWGGLHRSIPGPFAVQPRPRAARCRRPAADRPGSASGGGNAPGCLRGCHAGGCRRHCCGFRLRHHRPACGYCGHGRACCCAGLDVRGVHYRSSNHHCGKNCRPMLLRFCITFQKSALIKESKQS